MTSTFFSHLHVNKGSSGLELLINRHGVFNMLTSNGCLYPLLSVSGSYVVDREEVKESTADTTEIEEVTKEAASSPLEEEEGKEDGM